MIVFFFFFYTKFWVIIAHVPVYSFLKGHSFIVLCCMISFLFVSKCKNIERTTVRIKH